MGLSANATAICDLDAEIRDLQILRNSKLPFFHLPLEICVFIFSLACHHGRLPEKRGSEPLVTTPFVISSVCHAWCVMARSTPKLWSSISLRVRPTQKETEIQAKLLDQWLCLARSLPLSITMTVDWNEARQLESNPSALMAVAASRSHQWESLDFFGPSIWAEILKSKMGPVSNVKSLDLKLFNKFRDTAESPFSSMFLDAPKLRTVTIGYEDIDVGLPYHQLEELTVWGYIHTPDFVAFLNKCMNLTFCRIQTDRDVSQWTRANTGRRMFVNLPKVVTLEIMAWHLGWLLGYFLAPALESITIPLMRSIDIEAFLAFLTHSNVVLKQLTIVDHTPREEESLLKMLDALAHLTHLELDELHVILPFPQDKVHWLPSRTFFDYLATPNTLSGGSGLPMPRLISFKYRGRFHNSENDTVDVDALEKMLLARWNVNLSAGASRLQRFSMSIINSPESVAELERSPVVKELRKEGMHLAFNLAKERMHRRIFDYRD